MTITWLYGIRSRGSYTHSETDRDREMGREERQRERRGDVGRKGEKKREGEEEIGESREREMNRERERGRVSAIKREDNECFCVISNPTDRTIYVLSFQ